MDVRRIAPIQGLLGCTTRAESGSGRIGPISLEAKQTGERSAGNPHAAFDAAEAGNAAWSRWCDTRRRKGEPTGNTNFDLNRRASLRPYLREAEGETPSAYSPLYSDGERPSLSGGDHRLGEPCSAGLAAFEYDGHAFLPRRAGRNPGATRKASDIQYRSRRAVHQRRIHSKARSRRNRDFDGRTRPFHGQHLHRTLVALDQVREVHLKAYADGREARAGIGSWMTFYNFRRPHQAMNNQMPMAVWRAGMDRIEGRRTCGYAASLGQRKRVATYPQ